MKKKLLNKPRYIGYVAASVDGRISLSKTQMPNWTSAEDWKFFQKSLAQADAVVVGRNTYAVAAHRIRKRTAYVLSRRIHSSFCRGTVTFINPHNSDLEKLLAKHRTVAVIGGALTYQYMLHRRLLHEIYVTLEPYIFSRGREMFSGGNISSPLRLLSIKRLNKSGTILLHYKVL